MITGTGKGHALEILENLAGVMRRKIDEYKEATGQPAVPQEKKPAAGPEVKPEVAQQLQNLYNKNQHNNLV